MASGKEIRDLLINIKTEGGKEAFDMLQKIDDKVDKGINKNLRKTNTNLNTIGRTIKRRIKDFEELKAAAKGTSSLGVANKATANAMKSISAELKTVVSEMKTLNITTAKTQADMYEMAGSMDFVAAQSEDAADGIFQVARTTEGLQKKQKKGIKSTTKFGNELGRMGNKGKGANKAMSGLMGTMSGPLGIIATLTASVYTLGEAFLFLKQTAELIRLEENIASIGDGNNLVGLAGELRRTSGFALSLDESLRTAAQSAAFGFSGEQMNEFVTSAKQASIALGINFNDALTRVTKGIAKQEVELLDELGVVTRLEPAMKKYAVQLGKEVNQLTDVERKEALRLETMFQMNKAYGEITTSSTEYEKALANAQSIVRIVAKEFVKLEDSLGILKLLNDYLSDYVTNAERASAIEGALDASSKASKKGLIEQVNAYVDVNKEIEENSRIMNVNQETMGEYSKFSRLMGGLLSEVGAGSGFAALFNAPFLENGTLEIIKLQDQIKILEQYNKDLAESQKALNFRNGIVNKDDIKEFVSFRDGFADISGKIQNFGTQATKGVKAFSDELGVATSLANAYDAALKEQGKTKANTATLELLDEVGIVTLEKIRLDYLARINEAYDRGYKTIRQYADAIQAVSDSQDSYSSDIKNIERVNWAKNQGFILDQKRQRLNNLISLEGAARGETALLKKLTLERLSLDIQREAIARSEAITENTELLNDAYTRAALISGDSGKSESSRLQEQVELQKALIASNKSSLTDAANITEQRKLELLILKQSLAVEKEKRQQRNDELTQAYAIAAINNEAAGKSQAFMLNEELELQKQLVDANWESWDLATRARENAKEELLIARALVAAKKEQYQIEGSPALTGLFGNAALAENQANKDLENDEAVSDFAAQGVSNAIDSLASLDTATGQIAQGFMNLGQIMNQSMQNGTFGADAAAASISAVAGVLSGINAQSVSEIDHQIAMEKKRDGQSAKSVAKLKELEKKKLKEQQKAKLQSAIMSTAAGIASSLELPFPFNLVAAGITGAMGLMQVNAIRNQGKNASALASAGSASTQSIEFGSRMNNVDLSQTATAGERAFVTGQAGTGTNANNFIGAAAGAQVEGGTAVNVGERGAEVFIPDVPGTIVPSGNISPGSSKPSLQVVINNDNLDAQSMIDRSDDLMEAIDVAIRAKFGKSIEDM